MIQQGKVVAFGGKGNLVAQVGHAVVDRSGGEHEHAGSDAFPDDATHEAVIPGFAALSGGFFVAEVVRFVNDDQVIVAPVDMSEINIARQPAVSGQVGVIEDIVVETVAGQEVAAIVGLVQGPVVAETFGTKDEDPVIAQLVILDDRQGLEGFPESDAVGNNTAAEAVELVDRANHPVTLEFIQFFPDSGVADTSCRLDDSVFVEIFAAGAEQVLEDERVDEIWGAANGVGLQGIDQLAFHLGISTQGGPLEIEPLAEQQGLFRCFGSLDEAQGIAGREAEAICAESQ